MNTAKQEFFNALMAQGANDTERQDALGIPPRTLQWLRNEQFLFCRTFERMVQKPAGRRCIRILLDAADAEADQPAEPVEAHKEAA